MLLESSVSLLVLVLLSTSSDVSATSGEDECAAASPRIELTATPRKGQAPVVCLSPGLPITFRFDAVLRQESLKIQEREWFEDWALGKQTFMLVPRDNLLAGKRTEVEVCFADDAAPSCATFVLVVHPGLGMPEVKVLRQPRSVAHFEQIAREAEAEVQQCRLEVQQLRAEHNVPDGLRGTLASGLVNLGTGIDGKDLTDNVTEKKGNALAKYSVYSYRAIKRVAVEVYLTNPGTTPWTAGGAVLRGPKNEVLKPLPLWQPSPILPAAPGEPGSRGRIVVEVMATEKEARGTYTLILWDAERQRTVTLGNVTFP
jgi:uncharacterized protein (TIGR02268 family)